MQKRSGTQRAPVEATRDRVAQAIADMTDWTPPGQIAPRVMAGGLLLAIQFPGYPLDTIEIEQLALDLGYEVILVDYDADRSLALPVSVRIGVRLPWRVLWQRGTYRLWAASETDVACFVADDPDVKSYYAVEASRLDACCDLPFTNPAEREVGFARAAARLRRLVREG